jgi:hypothetical protein
MCVVVLVSRKVATKMLQTTKINRQPEHKQIKITNKKERHNNSKKEAQEKSD